MDAYEWLKGSSIRSIGDHDWGTDEDTHQDSINIVNDLYKLDAVKVEVEADKEDECATVMIVALPEDRKAARAILLYLGALHADNVEEEENGIVSVAWIS